MYDLWILFLVPHQAFSLFSCPFQVNLFILCEWTLFSTNHEESNIAPRKNIKKENEEGELSTWVEMKQLNHGWRLAGDWDLGSWILRVTELVELIRSQQIRSFRIEPWLSLRKLLDQDWLIQVSHILREGNRCADFLVSLGRRLGQSYIEWQEPPNEVLMVLLEDQEGVEIHRIRRTLVWWVFAPFFHQIKNNWTTAYEGGV